MAKKLTAVAELRVCFICGVQLLDLENAAAFQTLLVTHVVCEHEDYVDGLIATRNKARVSNEERLRGYFSRALVEVEHELEAHGATKVLGPDGKRQAMRPLIEQALRAVKKSARDAGVEIDRALAVGEWAPRACEHCPKIAKAVSTVNTPDNRRRQQC